MSKYDDVAWLDIPNTQEYSGISRSKIYKLLVADEIEGRKIGKRLLISKSSIDAMFSRLPKFASKRAA